MPTTWTHLLLVLGRHALVIVAVVMVVVTPLGTHDLLPGQSDHAAATASPSPDGFAADRGGVDGCDNDPDACGQCHCSALETTMSEDGVALPASLHLGFLVRVDHRVVITDWSFAPDPPPDRA